MTESNIRAAFRDQEIKLSVGDWFDETDLKRAVNIVTQLLASHGYQSATVKPIFERDVSSSTVTITFDVEEGPKTKK
jgi:outer membrane protein assembly factor BamA